MPKSLSFLEFADVCFVGGGHVVVAADAAVLLKPFFRFVAYFSCLSVCLSVPGYGPFLRLSWGFWMLPYLTIPFINGFLHFSIDGDCVVVVCIFSVACCCFLCCRCSADLVWLLLPLMR